MLLYHYVACDHYGELLKDLFSCSNGLIILFGQFLRSCGARILEPKTTEFLQDQEVEKYL